MRHAFSLVEVIIAIALGMVILVTIYAGFRVASQSVTITERMALENKLLIGGMVGALEELDHWTAFDRPGHQPLRPNGPFKTIQPGAGGYAEDGSDWSSLPQPFTPFNAASSGGAASWPASGAPLPYASRWLVNDPATWYRGDGGLAYRDGGFRTDLSPWGNYALFSCAAANVQVAPEGGGDVAVAQRWLPAQHKGLKYGLGFYGWYAYLPANAFIDYYDVQEGGSRGIRPSEFRLLDDTPNQQTMHQIGQAGRLRRQIGTGSGLLMTGSERAATRPFSLYTNHLGISAYPPGAGADEQRQRVNINRQMAGSFGWGAEAISTYPALLSSLAAPRPLVASHPRHWPEVGFDVRRTMKWSMVINLCTIRAEDPVTGRMAEISFTAIGTTLRGARMTRGLDL